MATSLRKHSCVTCARRKVRCDKRTPCSNCSKAQNECSYQAPAPSQRHRKRVRGGELLSKITEYENLLRRNKIRFQPLDTSWIPSPLEEELSLRPPNLEPGSPNEADRHPKEQSSEAAPEEPPNSQSTEKNAWFALPKDLRIPPITHLGRPGLDSEVRFSESYSSFDIQGISSPLMPIQMCTLPQLTELHPEPRHIFKLWQAFVDNVNPLTKVIHVPTLQQRISEASWNLETITKPLEAVLFAVYSLAILSLGASDCIQVFGETKSVLMTRYRSAAAQALIAADMHSTRDLEVLQALVLFLLLEPRSELASIGAAVATRIGNKMGLHLTGTDPGIPFFEQEMRLRVWWQIRSLELRVRRGLSDFPFSESDFGNVRMPLNVNDAELHPQMTGPPAVEHTGATEMLYCLMKCELGYWLRNSSVIAAEYNENARGNNLFFLDGTISLAKKKQLVADAQQLFEEKYLRYFDLSIPLHHFSDVSVRLSIHRVRFWCYHPRNQSREGGQITPADLDLAFESSVRLLQLNYDLYSTNFSSHLFNHVMSQTQVHAVVYMISELRIRVSGDLVRSAWELVERLYEDHTELLQNNGRFYTALADLTLEAWGARWNHVGTQGEVVPQCIGTLQAARGGVRAEVAEYGTTPVISGMLHSVAGLDPDDTLDWGYWNELVQL